MNVSFDHFPVAVLAGLIALVIPGLAAAAPIDLPGAGFAECSCPCQEAGTGPSASQGGRSVWDAAAVPVSEMTADEFLARFEPAYYRALGEVERDFVAGVAVEDLPSIRLGGSEAPGSGMGAWAEEVASDDSGRLLQVVATLGAMHPGDEVHMRIVVLDPRSGSVMCNEMYEGGEYLEVSRMIDLRDFQAQWRVVVLGYAVCDGTYGVPVFRCMDSELSE